MQCVMSDFFAEITALSVHERDTRLLPEVHDGQLFEIFWFNESARTQLLGFWSTACNKPSSNKNVLAVPSVEDPSSDRI